MPKTFKFYAALGGVLILSILIGNALAEGDYMTPSILLIAALGIAAIVVPGYSFFLALAILCPFSFPLPYVYRFPFILIILTLCVAKYVVTQALTAGSLRFRYVAGIGIVLLFGWVGVRYCMNPVAPGLAIGSGNAVTGFRAYLNYGICFALILLFPLLVRTREDVVNLLRWMGYLAVFFILLLLPLVFTRSVKVLQILTTLGITVILFDNGWLRFIPLPEFGLTLLTLALLPHVRLFRFFWLRGFAVALASAAIVLGGNRASLAMAAVILICITLASRRIRLVALALVGVAVALASLYVLGENLKFARGVGFLRVAALVSPRAAQQCEAWQTVVWRKLRWERAMVDIRKHPWIGSGYGGLSGIFAYATYEDFEQNAIEIDVAAGSIHNGFLSSTRAFGIPFCALFVCVLVYGIWTHGLQAMREYRRDLLQSNLHCFVFANLASTPLAVYIGADLNNTLIWFYITLGLIVSKLPAKQEHATSVFPPQPISVGQAGRALIGRA